MAETTWLDAEECLAKGFATEIEKTENVNKKRMSTQNIDNFLKEANLITNKFLPKPLTKKSMLKVTNRLGLTEDASEESILQAIQAIQNKAEEDKAALEKSLSDKEAELEAKEAELAAKDAELELAQAETCKNMINTFVASGKLQADETITNKWIELAKNDFEGTKSLLESLPINKVANRLPEEQEKPEAKPGDYMAQRLKEIANRNKK